MENLCDLAAESAILAGIFKYGVDAYYDVSELLQTDTFTDDVNQSLYKCFSILIEQDGLTNFDRSSVISKLYNMGLSYIVDRETTHLNSIFNRDILLENVRRWAVRIRKLHITRLLLIQVRNAEKSLYQVTGDEAIESILGLAEKPIFDFSQLLHGNSTTEPTKLSENIDEYIDYLASNPVDMVGVDTGFPIYNKSIGGGIRRKTVGFVGARQGDGKSLLALNIGLNATKNKVKVLYVDTEMNKDDHRPRSLSNLTFDMNMRVNIDEIETGQFAKLASKYNNIKTASKLLDESFYYISVVGCPFEEILSVMRRWIIKVVGNTNGITNDCLILYDYFKLSNSENLNSNWAEFQLLGFQMTSLHNFANKYDVPILAFTQLNREAIKESHGGVIRGSDRPLDCVTHFSIFREKSEEELAKQRQNNSSNQLLGNYKLEVIKSRHGAGASNHNFVNIQKYGEYAKIIEV